MTTEAQESRRAAASLRLALAFALSLITAVTFSPSLWGEFVYDDVLLVGDAPATQSISAALAHWMEPFWAFDDPDAAFQRGLWRPMTSLALATGRAAAGGDPFGFHLVSIVLHVLATLACFRLAARLLQRTTGSAVRAEWAAAIVALLFALHPAQVESVAWISAVNDPAWGLFGLLALWRYDVAAGDGKAPLGAALLALLALMCKETAVVLFPAFLLLDFAAGRRLDAVRTTLLAAPLVLWYVARVLVFEGVDAGIFREHGDFQMSAARALSFRLELLGGFLETTFWPTDSRVFRAVHPVLPEDSTAIATASLWVLGVGVAAILLWRRGVLLGAAGLALLVVATLPIVATPARAGLFPLSDRYLYLGLFGAALALTAGLARARSVLPLLALGLALPAALASTSWTYQDRFQDEISFRVAGAEDAPRTPYVLWGAGRAYLEEYQRTLDIEDLQQAYLYFLRSLKEGTVYGDGSFVDDLALPAPQRAGRLEQLILDTPASERQPDPTVMWTADDRLQATLGQITVNTFIEEIGRSPDFQYPLTIALAARKLWPDEPRLELTIAQLHERRGEVGAAKEAISKVVRKQPANTEALQILARVLMREGDADGARSTLSRAVQLNGADDALRLELASVALASKRYDLAERELDAVLASTQRTNVRALVLRAALATRRDLPVEAMTWLDRALELDPENGAAQKERGLAAVKLGDVDGALDAFARACEQLPDDFESHYTFAALMLQQQPAADAPPATATAWEQAVVDAMVRAYVLSPRTGEEQLLLQQQIAPFLRGDPNSAFNLAMTLNKQGRGVLALFWLQRVVEWRERWAPSERAENLVKAFTMSGTLYLNAGKPDEALEAFRSAVLSDPGDFRARFELGDLLFKTGDRAAAAPHLRRALELFDDSDVAPEMREAVRGTIMKRLSALEATAGPPLPGLDADSVRDE